MVSLVCCGRLPKISPELLFFFYCIKEWIFAIIDIIKTKIPCSFVFFLFFMKLYAKVKSMIRLGSEAVALTIFVYIIAPPIQITVLYNIALLGGIFGNRNRNGIARAINPRSRKCYSLSQSKVGIFLI